MKIRKYSPVWYLGLMLEAMMFGLTMILVPIMFLIFG